MTFRDPFATESTPSRKISSSSSDLTDYLRPTAFLGHRDTLARIFLRRHSAPQVPANVLDRLLNYVSFSDYKSLRLICRQWLEFLPRPKLPASYRVPGEVLQQVYRHLLPSDFDVVRHTCRSWFLASLDKSLLKSMLRKAGCLQTAQADLNRRQESYEARRRSFDEASPVEHDGEYCHPPSVDDIISEEWLYSKRLATESKLTADWNGSPYSRLQVTDEVNFSTLIQQDRSATKAFKSFTVSACGKFLMLVDRKDVLVYSLRDISCLDLVTHLACGRDVLGVSMDTSSNRHTIAVLLEGRIGMCWDLGQGYSLAGESMTLGLQTDVLRSGPIPVLSSTPLDIPTCRATLQSLKLGGRQISDNSIFEPENFRPRSVSQPGGRPASIYRNVGSPDDSPRSVAICPQRKCVAFGCKMGIELHWVDALTGGDLNRWFPLAAPSDHLYFLPQRTGDSTKKLRLISSAARPALPYPTRLPTRHDSGPKITDASRRRSMTGLFFGNLPFPSSILPGAGNRLNGSTSPNDEDRQGVLRTVDCDHYRAVPLSDGVHVLFTDPESRLVCLGSDAPLGGPTKLLRKTVFVPPQVTGEQLAEISPVCYTAGQEMNWGVRIVVAYSDGTLVIYNIPADVFERIRNLRSSLNVWDELAGVLAESDMGMDLYMNRLSTAEPGHPNASTEPNTGNEAANEATDFVGPFATLQVPGVIIAQIEHDGDVIEDIAVECRYGGLKVWVFMASGLARLYDLYLRRGQEVRRRRATREGTFVDDEVLSVSEKGKEKAAERASRVHFAGLDGVYETESSYEDEFGIVASRETCGPLQIEILTDWRGMKLPDPYVVFLPESVGYL